MIAPPVYTPKNFFHSGSLNIIESELLTKFQVIWTRIRENIDFTIFDQINKFDKPQILCSPLFPEWVDLRHVHKFCTGCGHLSKHEKQTFADNFFVSIYFITKFSGKLCNTVLVMLAHFFPHNMLKWSRMMGLEHFGTNASLSFYLLFFSWKTVFVYDY